MILKDEIAPFIERYLKDINQFNNDDYNFDLKNAINCIPRALIKYICFESPDGYFYDEQNDILFIFEQFVFDCSKNGTYVGSTLIKNTADMRKEVENEISKTENYYESTKIIEQGVGIKRGNVITYKLGDNGDIYRDNYIDNFNTNFTKHSKKVNQYIQNCITEIKKTPKNIITTFLIEDITSLGTYYLENGKKSDLVDLLATTQFYKLFKASQVDCVMFAMRDPLFISICDRSILEKEPKYFIDLHKKELFVMPAVPYITFAKKYTL